MEIVCLSVIPQRLPKHLVGDKLSKQAQYSNMIGPIYFLLLSMKGNKEQYWVSILKAIN